MVRWLKNRTIRKIIIGMGLVAALGGVKHLGGGEVYASQEKNFMAIVSREKERRMQVDLQTSMVKEEKKLEKKGLPKPEKDAYLEIQNNYENFLELIKEHDFYKEELETIDQEIIELRKKHQRKEVSDQELEKEMKELAEERSIVFADAKEVWAEIQKAHEEHKTLMIRLEQVMEEIERKLESDPFNQELKARLKDCEDSYSDLSRISIYFEAFQ
tara:strand:+ start:5648 stop:6292 length:645 start_codon:yes stop_codon:yes gene_type:complete